MLRTWDIFDTLIARRCVFPQRVFDIVEQRIKVKGFAQMRPTAERLIMQIGISYKLDEIYELLYQLMHVDKSVVERWKQVELDVELEQAIPITENLSQVKSGDVLISDMYLPEDFVRRMLEKCGLSVPVEIVITNHSKVDGKIWQRFREEGVYLFHTGDNELSDIAKPREFKLESSWTVLSRPNQYETQLLNIDFEFGAYLRELRLANPFTEEIKRNYWSMFVLNIGILMLIAKLLDKIQKHYGFEYLGFCGRDTYYMRQIYQRLKDDQNESMPANNYLYYSRKLISNSESELLKYFKHEINGRKALMIDLFGTGLNLNMLRLKSGLQYAILLCLLLDRKTSVNIYPKLSHFLPDNWLHVDDALRSSQRGGGIAFACLTSARITFQTETISNCLTARRITRPSRSRTSSSMINSFP